MLAGHRGCPGYRSGFRPSRVACSPLRGRPCPAALALPVPGSVSSDMRPSSFSLPAGRALGVVLAGPLSVDPAGPAGRAVAGRQGTGWPLQSWVHRAPPALALWPPALAQLCLVRATVMAHPSHQPPGTPPRSQLPFSPTRHHGQLRWCGLGGVSPYITEEETGAGEGGMGASSRGGPSGGTPRRREGGGDLGRPRGPGEAAAGSPRLVCTWSARADPEPPSPPRAWRSRRSWGSWRPARAGGGGSAARTRGLAGPHRVTAPAAAGEVGGSGRAPAGGTRCRERLAPAPARRSFSGKRPGQPVCIAGGAGSALLRERPLQWGLAAPAAWVVGVCARVTEACAPSRAAPAPWTSRGAPRASTGVTRGGPSSFCPGLSPGSGSSAGTSGVPLALASPGSALGRKILVFIVKSLQLSEHACCMNCGVSG